jgi:3-hydroxy-9,10-secoandrosta-1,3,5(10)-triene-9,17-dione monooxygenase
MFRALIPERHGGTGTSLLAVHEAVIAVATACTSTAWVAGLFAMHGRMVTWFDERAQRELWERGPDTIIASAVAPVGRIVKTGRDYRVNGRWSFCSGIDHADWILVCGNEAEGGGKPQSRAFLVPAREATVEDDWHVVGLRGTGSKSFVLEDVVVPEYRTESIDAVNSGTARGMAGGPLTGRTWRPMFDYSFCPIAIGAGLAAVRLFREWIAVRKSAFTGAAYAARASSCARLARAVGEINAARTLLRRDVADIEAAAQLGEPHAAAIISRVGFNASYVTEQCSRAVARLYRGSGGRAIYESQELQRIFRDVHTITQHMAMDLDAASELYGRKLLDDPSLEIE